MWKIDGKDDSSRPGKAAGTVDTLIGRQSEITGDVRFAGGLHVDGRVKGKVTAGTDKNTVLSVSESGAVEGDVRVPHVVLNGTVEGDVHASQRLTLSAKARVNGNVYYKLIEMTSGAVINGQLVYEGDEKIAKIAHKTTDDQQEDTPTGTGGDRPAAFGGGTREKV